MEEEIYRNDNTAGYPTLVSLEEAEHANMNPTMDRASVRVEAIESIIFEACTFQAIGLLKLAIDEYDKLVASRSAKRLYGGFVMHDIVRRSGLEMKPEFVEYAKSRGAQLDERYG